MLQYPAVDEERATMYVLFFLVGMACLQLAGLLGWLVLIFMEFVRR